MAKEEGVVTEVTDKRVSVKYKSGLMESYQIGNIYGRLEGSVFPHALITDLTVGSKFKQNDPIAYNKNFFERDWLDNYKLIMKFNGLVTVALTNNNESFEDSCSVSTKLSQEATTTVIKEKIFVIDFNKQIEGIISEGTEVNPETILFTLLDENTDYNNLSQSSIEMLQSLAALAPKSKYKGVIDRYEVKYNGEVTDMSSSLRKLVTKLDRQIYEETKGTFREVKSNRVNAEYRSEGKNLLVDTLELKVFIRVNLSMGIGDKCVLASQMKSICSHVFSENINTVSGDRIDVMFSYEGLLKRIVSSPVLMGTTNRLVRHVNKQITDLYFS